MNFDLQSVSVMLGIASAIVGLAFKLMPRASDRLKRDLELLKLAREAKASYLPLQRHVDAQINEAYLKKGLSLGQRSDIFFGQFFFSLLMSTFLMAMIGVAVAYGSGFLLSLAEESVGRVLGSFVAFGVFVGVVGGIKEAQQAINEARSEVEERERIAIQEDQEALRNVNLTSAS